MPVSLDFGDAGGRGLDKVSGGVVGMIDAVESQVRRLGDGPFHLHPLSHRVGWPVVAVDAERYFRQMPDEDGYAIVYDDVDLSGPARDELGPGPPGDPIVPGETVWDFAQPVEPT